MIAKRRKQPSACETPRRTRSGGPETKGTQVCNYHWPWSLMRLTYLGAVLNVKLNDYATGSIVLPLFFRLRLHPANSIHRTLSWHARLLTFYLYCLTLFCYCCLFICPALYHIIHFCFSPLCQHNTKRLRLPQDALASALWDCLLKNDKWVPYNACFQY